jgi:hypothetical protein
VPDRSRLTDYHHAIVPWRIFIDTCTFQVIGDCGGFVFGEDDLPKATDYAPGAAPQVLSRPDAEEILVSLKRIFHFNDRANFDWIASETSIEEVDAARDHYNSRYVRDIIDHSTACLADHPPTEAANRMVRLIASGRCGSFGAKDRQLLIEAAASECDVFLTIEKRLPRNADAVLRKMPLLITTPAGLWELLKPHLVGH